MKRARPRRTLACIGLAGAIAAGAAVLAQWPGLERRWHLWRLERSPELLEAMLISERPARQEAVVEFLRQDAGRHRLFELFLREIDAAEPGVGVVQKVERRGLRDSERGVICMWQDGVRHQDWRSRASYGSFSITQTASLPERRRRVLEHLDACAGRVIHRQGIDYFVSRVASGRAAAPPWIADQSEDAPPAALEVQDPARHVVFYRGTAIPY